MIEIPIGLLAASSGSCALVCFVLIIYFARSTSTSPKRRDVTAVQASHVSPTPRIGGLAILLALITAGTIDQAFSNWNNYVFLLISTIPIFAAGLCEDLGYFASPVRRLGAASLSGALFVAVTGQWLSWVGIPGLDVLLKWAPFAVAFSVFLAVSLIHAFNLIDGLNGLAGLTGLGCSLSLATIAQQTGLTEHRDVLLIISAAIIGFLSFNYPFGIIFLGDAGAYVIGHLLVWMSVSILCNAPSVSPFAILLIFFFPIADTLLAILRRLAMGKSIVQPDRLHFHQLVMRGVEIVLLGQKKRRVANPLATLLMLPLIFIPMISGVALTTNHSGSAISFVAFGALFFATYKLGMWIAPRLRRSIFSIK